VSDNSYRPPEPDTKPAGKNPARNELLWRVFFWISAVLMTLVMAFMPFEILSLFDAIDLLMSIVGTVGLYGFAYYKPVGNVVFWRYFFYFVLFESFVYTLILPLMGVEQYGQTVSFDGNYFTGLIYLGFYLVALNGYAYKRPFIWE
jgi:hypothetical protein